MAATFDGTDRGFHDNGYHGLESHFGVAGSGRIKQWQDLDFQADANFDGNHRCISIETADKGETFPQWAGSDVPAWTAAQIDTLVGVVRWLCDTFDIPKVLVPDSKPGRRGIAYHRLGIPHSTHKPDAPGGPWLGPGGELWTELPKGLGKVCPGDRRIAQLKDVVIPRVQQAGDEDMPLNDADKAFIRDQVLDIVRQEGITGNAASAATGVLALVSEIANLDLQLDVDEGALASALAPALTARLGALSAKDLTAVATAVNDEQARRIGP
jgi:hypothetical protein